MFAWALGLVVFSALCFSVIVFGHKVTGAENRDYFIKHTLGDGVVAFLIFGIVAAAGSATCMGFVVTGWFGG